MKCCTVCRISYFIMNVKIVSYAHQKNNLCDGLHQENEQSILYYHLPLSLLFIMRIICIMMLVKMDIKTTGR